MNELNKEKARSRANQMRCESKGLKLKKLEGDYHLIKDNVMRHNAMRFEK